MATTQDGAATMPEKLVTITTFHFPHEAHLVRTRLESEEIEAFVADEHTARIMPFFGPAIGWIKLQVRESDEERAKEILARLELEEGLPPEQPPA